MRLNVAIFMIVYAVIFQIAASGQTISNLIVSGSEVRLPTEKGNLFTDVQITDGAYLTTEAFPTFEKGLRITSNSLVLDASSTISANINDHQGKVQIGTPDVTLLPEGETEGNGAGNYGGYGYNYFQLQKPTYGDPTSFTIMAGSRGTEGETIRYRWGGQIQQSEGYISGPAGGKLTIIGNEITIKGRLKADGQSGYGSSCSFNMPGYSGSGGGILIAAKNLMITNTARITANGGEYAFQVYPNCLPGPLDFFHQELIGKRDGGGGRIKIFYEQGTISPEAIIEAKGWEDGTVHIEQVKSIDDLMRPQSDINKDDVVDHEDLMLLKKEWHQALTPIPVPVDTPTPTQTQMPTATP